MRTIWKFPLEFTTTQAGVRCEVDMPRGAAIVHFAFEYRGPLDQGPRAGVPTVWAQVDDREPRERHTFEIFGTGHPLPDGAQHVATWDAEPFVWHLFDTSWVVAIPDEVQAAGQEAVNAYRLLEREGFEYRPDRDAPVWAAPDDEPQTTEQMMALATLAEHGLGTLASA